MQENLNCRLFSDTIFTYYVIIMSGNNKSSPLRTNSRSLSLTLQEYLLRDIERSGGIENINLTRLLKSRPDLHADRDKVRNKINYWKRIGAVEYLEVLRTLNVSPSSNTLKRTGSSPEAEEESKMSDPFNDLTPAKSVGTRIPSSVDSRGKCVSLEYSNGKCVFIYSLIIISILSLLKILRQITYSDNPEIIEVDTKYPENNKQFMVVAFKDVKFNGIFINGFYIELEIDIRDYANEKYKARLIDTNEIVFTVPSVSHGYIHDRVERTKSLTNFNLYCERTQEAIDVSRNAIMRDKERQSKTIVLRFPEYISLSVEHFYPGSRNGELECEVVPYLTKCDQSKTHVTKTLLFWKVSVIEPEVRRYETTTDSAKKALDKLTSRLQGTQLNW